MAGHDARLAYASCQMDESGGFELRDVYPNDIGLGDGPSGLREKPGCHHALRELSRHGNSLELDAGWEGLAWYYRCIMWNFLAWTEPCVG